LHDEPTNRTQPPRSPYIYSSKEIFMKKTYLLFSLLLAGALLSGCAAELLSTNEKMIVVKSRPSQLPDATEIAETECQKRGGRHARLITKPAEGQYGFECIR
jgi:hypothetical protein